MEFKGTKEEWRIKDGNYENGRGMFSITTHTTNIATIWGAVEEKETIPNAKLIAAAPEMLLALQRIVALGNTGLSLVASKKYAKDAIEKALK